MRCLYKRVFVLPHTWRLVAWKMCARRELHNALDNGSHACENLEFQQTQNCDCNVYEVYTANTTHTIHIFCGRSSASLLRPAGREFTWRAVCRCMSVCEIQVKDDRGSWFLVAVAFLSLHRLVSKPRQRIYAELGGPRYILFGSHAANKLQPLSSNLMFPPLPTFVEIYLRPPCWDELCPAAVVFL